MIDFETGTNFLSKNPKIANNYLNPNELIELKELSTKLRNCLKTSTFFKCNKTYDGTSLINIETSKNFPTIPLFSIISEIGFNLKTFNNENELINYYKDSLKELNIKEKSH